MRECTDTNDLFKQFIKKEKRNEKNKQTNNLPNNKCACQGRTMQNKNLNFATYILFVDTKLPVFPPPDKRPKKKKRKKERTVTHL